jgi:hypothetical protein
LPHRVIYCALGCASLLANLRHESLRKLDSGSVESVSDEVVATLLLNDPSLPILFFSRSAYDQAMRGLTDSGIDDALRNRLSRWAPKAVDHALDWVARDQRRSLTLTARALKGSSGQAAQVFESHFDLGLDLMTSIAGSGRFDRMELADLISAVIEKDAMLIQELGNIAEARTRNQLAKALAEELRRQGRGDFSQALPYEEPGRGVWIVPSDKGLLEYLKTSMEPSVVWRGGVVAKLSLRAIKDFQKQGKKIAILYPDPGALLQDMAELSKPELILRFEDHSTASEAVQAQELGDYLNMLRLEVALLRRALRARAATDAPGIVALLDQQIRTETAILATQFAMAGSWLPSGDAEAPPAARLRAADDEMTVDASFLADYARRRDNVYVAGRLEEILKIKRLQIERLKGAQG